MLPLGHLGIGAQFRRPFPRLPLKALLLGTLLPDLIDKPLYYVPAWITSRHGAELGWISGTRTISHSLLFLALLLAVSALPGGRRRWWLALSLGVATHLLLDNVAEPFQELSVYSSRIALLFPLYGWRFPVAMHRSVGEHLAMHLHFLDLAGEAVGAVLLGALWRKNRKPSREHRPAGRPAS
jgi:hypothetical protein